MTYCQRKQLSIVKTLYVNSLPLCQKQRQILNNHSLTVEPRSHSDQNYRHTPVPQQWAESWSVAVPHLLEGQLVID